MFLYFSDWTTDENLRKLEEQDLPHAGRLIKVFATHEDPSETLGRYITTVEELGYAFDPDKQFKYYNRGPWLGSELETYLDHFHLPEEIKQKARALFRFAESPQMEITNLAMSPRNTFRHYNHPLEIIDGLEEALQRQRYNGLHLDIFSPPSIERLEKFIDLKNPEVLVSIRESVQLSGSNPEGSQPPTKES